MARKAKAAVLDRPEPEPKSPEKPAEQPKPEPQLPPHTQVAKAGASTEAERIAESRTVLQHPLQPGQQYFESPEGYIMVGEKTTGRVLCRQANGGKGLWINPRR